MDDDTLREWEMALMLNESMLERILDYERIGTGAEIIKRLERDLRNSIESFKEAIKEKRVELKNSQ